MDEQVINAMKRWPDVPAAFGWLRLDRRGIYYLIDRNAPGFDEARDGMGSPITNASIIEFISRNWLSDAAGRWLWQNGPQRAFADLDLAPLVFRVLTGPGDATLVAHTGYPVGALRRAIVFSDDDLFLDTELGPGVVHDLDLAALDLQGEKLRIAGQVLTVEQSDADPAAVLHFVRKPRS